MPVKIKTRVIHSQFRLKKDLCYDYKTNPDLFDSNFFTFYCKKYVAISFLDASAIDSPSL